MVKQSDSKMSKLNFNEFNMNYFNNDHLLADFDTFEEVNDKVQYLLNSLLSMTKKSNLNTDFVYDLNSLLKLDLNLAFGFMHELNDEQLTKIDDLIDYPIFNTEQFESILYPGTLNIYCE